jgi:hypothetical protein
LQCALRGAEPATLGFEGGSERSRLEESTFTPWTLACLILDEGLFADLTAEVLVEKKSKSKV